MRTEPIATLVYDRDTLAIVSASERAAASLGYSREELLGLSLADVHPPAEVASALDVLSAASGPLRLGAQPDPPWRLARKDGSTAEAEIESDEIESGGRACRFLIWRERRDADARDPGKLEAFELRSVLVDACASAVSSARAKGIGLDVDLAPGLPGVGPRPAGAPAHGARAARPLGDRRDRGGWRRALRTPTRVDA